MNRPKRNILWLLRTPLRRDQRLAELFSIVNGNQPISSLDVRTKFEERTGERMPLGRVYSNLEKLERQGFPTSEYQRRASGVKEREVVWRTTGTKEFRPKERKRLVSILELLGDKRAAPA